MMSNHRITESSNRPISGDAGHSLVEAVVALAILIGILGPAAGVVAVLVANQSAADRIIAFTLAEDAIEDAVSRKAFVDSTWNVASPALELDRHIVRDGDLLVVTVTAKRSPRGPELVSLTTAVIERDR